MNDAYKEAISISRMIPSDNECFLFWKSRANGAVRVRKMQTLQALARAKRLSKRLPYLQFRTNTLNPTSNRWIDTTAENTPPPPYRVPYNPNEEHLRRKPNESN